MNTAMTFPNSSDKTLFTHLLLLMFVLFPHGNPGFQSTDTYVHFTQFLQDLAVKLARLPGLRLDPRFQTVAETSNLIRDLIVQQAIHAENQQPQGRKRTDGRPDFLE